MIRCTSLSTGIKAQESKVVDGSGMDRDEVKAMLAAMGVHISYGGILVMAAY